MRLVGQFLGGRDILQGIAFAGPTATDRHQHARALGQRVEMLQKRALADRIGSCVQCDVVAAALSELRGLVRVVPVGRQYFRAVGLESLGLPKCNQAYYL